MGWVLKYPENPDPEEHSPPYYVWEGEGRPSDEEMNPFTWQQNAQGRGWLKNEYKEEGGEWRNYQSAAPHYQSVKSSAYAEAPFLVKAFDAALSILSPYWAIVSGATKVGAGAGTGNMGLAAGGVLQGVGGAYGASGGGVGTGDFSASGQEILASPNAAWGEGWTGAAVGTGDFDPVTGQEIMASPTEAYGEGYLDDSFSWKRFGEQFAKNQIKKYGTGMLMDAVAGGAEGGGGPLPMGFSLDDSPLADVFKDKGDSLDKIYKMTGETGDLATAAAATKAFEAKTIEFAELEKEIRKLSVDPDYKAIEPELRVVAMDALEQGMSPKQATAYAFEKAKKERAFSEFLTEFKMRKKLEAAA